MPLVIGQYDLDSAVVGSAYKITLTPILDDSAKSYLPISGGRADQEDRRLEAGVIAEIEALVETGLQSYTRVYMTIDEAVTPKWDNQIEVIFLNAARGRISTHKFTSALNVGTQIRTVGVETLP